MSNRGGLVPTCIPRSNHTSSVFLCCLYTPAPAFHVYHQELQPSRRVPTVALLGLLPALDLMNAKYSTVQSDIVIPSSSTYSRCGGLAQPGLPQDPAYMPAMCAEAQLVPSTSFHATSGSNSIAGEPLKFPFQAHSQSWVLCMPAGAEAQFSMVSPILHPGTHWVKLLFAFRLSIHLSPSYSAS